MGSSFKRPETAAYKLRVYYQDGNAASLYSRDWKNGKHRPELGLKKLQQYVMKHSKWIKVALIYDKRGGKDVLVGKYAGGGWEIGPPIFENL